jgi:hypothetical protein
MRPRLLPPAREDRRRSKARPLSDASTAKIRREAFPRGHQPRSYCKRTPLNFRAKNIRQRGGQEMAVDKRVINVIVTDIVGFTEMCRRLSHKLGDTPEQNHDRGSHEGAGEEAAVKASIFSLSLSIGPVSGNTTHLAEIGISTVRIPTSSVFSSLRSARL